MGLKTTILEILKDNLDTKYLDVNHEDVAELILREVNKIMENKKYVSIK